jgi:hypothetical protein
MTNVEIRYDNEGRLWVDGERFSVRLIPPGL